MKKEIEEKKRRESEGVLGNQQRKQLGATSRFFFIGWLSALSSLCSPWIFPLVPMLVPHCGLFLESFEDSSNLGRRASKEVRVGKIPISARQIVAHHLQQREISLKYLRKRTGKNVSWYYKELCTRVKSSKDVRTSVDFVISSDYQRNDRSTKIMCQCEITIENIQETFCKVIRKIQLKL